MDRWIERAGEGLAQLYLLYGFLFLAGGCLLCLHVLLLLLLGMYAEDPRFRWLVRSVEILYGLVNPLVYLLFLQRAFALPQYAPLTAAAWALLLIVWTVRCWGGFDGLLRSGATRQAVRVVLLFALLCLVAFFAKDAGDFLRRQIASDWTRPRGWVELLFSLLYPLNLAALYALPALAIAWHMRAAREEARWAGGAQFFLLSPRFALASGVLVFLTLGFWCVPQSSGSAQRQTLAHRAEIVEAARRNRLDPRLIASILYVTVRDDSTPFSRSLERAAMGAWLVDSTDNFGVGQALDVSVGVTQIKPLTAMTALVIRAAASQPSSPKDSLLGVALSRLGPSAHYKEYRGLPTLGPEWRLPPPALPGPDPAFETLESRSRIVEELFDDRLNIEMCGLILSLYAIQWEVADPAWSIRQRPEVLATLYQIGFEKSRPRANPQANDFGERVRAVFESPWMNENFGPG